MVRLAAAASSVRALAMIVIAIWVVFALDRLLPLEQLGLRPLQWSGLTGIVAMPFLHSDWTHLTTNTLPLLALFAVLTVTHTRPLAAVVTIVVASGVLLWLFGRPGIHVGASALIFGLASCLIAGAWRGRSVVALLAALLVVLLYGGSLLGGLLPGDSRVSWDGHLAGAVAGVVTGLAGVGQARPTKA